MVIHTHVHVATYSAVVHYEKCLSMNLLTETTEGQVLSLMKEGGHIYKHVIILVV